MKSSHMTLVAAILVALTFSINSAEAATDWYTINPITKYRTIAVKFEEPVSSVSVHYVGEKSGKCTTAKANVKVMAFVPEQTVKSDSALTVGLNLKSVGGKLSASSASSATMTLPAVFKYSFLDPTLSKVHYNIVYTRAGKQYSLGWRPDNGGGCTYTP